MPAGTIEEIEYFEYRLDVNKAADMWQVYIRATHRDLPKPPVGCAKNPDKERAIAKAKLTVNRLLRKPL